MTQSEMLKKIKNTLEDKIPALLQAFSLSEIQDFLDEPPTDEGRRQISVYLAEGNNTVAGVDEAFIIQFQLPGIMRPDRYLSAVWLPLHEILNPALVKMSDREMSHQTWYPGEIGGGGSSSFIYIEVRFYRPLDDEGV